MCQLLVKADPDIMQKVYVIRDYLRVI